MDFGWFLLAAMPALCAFVTVREICKIKRCSEEAEATVTGTKKHHDLETVVSPDDTLFVPTTRYSPYFEYQTHGKCGRKKMKGFDRNINGGKRSFPVGSKITIRYNPDKPSEYIVMPKRIIDLIGLIFCFLILLGLLIACIIIASTR